MAGYNLFLIIIKLLNKKNIPYKVKWAVALNDNNELRKPEGLF